MSRFMVFAVFLRLLHVTVYKLQFFYIYPE